LQCPLRSSPGLDGSRPIRPPPTSWPAGAACRRRGSEDSSRAAAIAERPGPSGDARHDAYLGALAEHLAAVHGLGRPAWSVEPDRFLKRFWFLTDAHGLRAISIAQAPAAFRRRGIFVPERSLDRV